jgi:hypothetical protein
VSDEFRQRTFRWSARTPPADSDDWCEVQELERDILLLYHQLAEDSYVMGDLYYGNVFALPYWNYLDPSGLEHDRAVFVQQGCLVMLLAMAWDQIDGSGAYLEKFRPEVLAGLAACTPLDDDARRLHACVDLAVRAASSPPSKPSQELIDESAWVHQSVVGAYFKKMAGLNP